MSLSATGPVGSGQAYRVVSVDESPPSGLEQFLGDASFTISKDGAESQIGGQGCAHCLGVRFHEKDVDHGGRDVRTWQITEADDVFGRFRRFRRFV